MSRRPSHARILSLGLLLSLSVACAVDDQTPADTAPDTVSRALASIQAQPEAVLADADHSFTARDVIIDNDGTTHTRFDRSYQGLRVIGGDVVVHNTATGGLRGVSMTLGQKIRLDTTPELDEEAAIPLAQAATAARPISEPAAELVVFARNGDLALAYEVVVTGIYEDQTPSELHVIIDAVTGDVLDRWEGVQTGAATGTGKSLYSGNVSIGTNSLSSGYEMRDTARGSSYTTNLNKKTAGTGTIFTDADNIWGNNTNADLASAGVDAHYGAATTWDFYATLGRTGIFNNGTGSYSRTHYGRSYVNAYWQDSCKCMTYGDGDGRSYGPLVSLDIAAHEMTHGVTANTANLTYSGESGGLNEATSDIMGAAVEFFANNTSDPGDWLMGEEIYLSGSGAIRYMYKPSLDGVSKDCWYSTIGTIDVHYSSGPANHFFHLLSEGTSATGANVCVSGTTVTGVGVSKAAAIWYRALSVYMTSSTNYSGARTATLSAATDLYGAGSAEYTAVANAWTAVSVP